MSASYRLHYFFDWGTEFCLWGGNDAARRAFGYPVDPQALPLAPQTRASIARLRTWHDMALNWDYPPDPGPWRQEDCDRFNAEAAALLRTIRHEFGPDYAVIDEFSPERDDPISTPTYSIRNDSIANPNVLPPFTDFASGIKLWGEPASRLS